jgi:UDP-N-acetyl-D-mannosaminuronic acid dehydrogenase
MTEISRVAVIGLGYIGLPTAAALATQGVNVTGVDVDLHVIDCVDRGEAPFTEPELAVVVSGAVSMGRLTGAREVPEADAYIIAVPTPFKEDFQADLSYVQAAAEAVAPRLRGGEIVILESTAPPGTTRRVSEWIVPGQGSPEAAHMTSWCDGTSRRLHASRSASIRLGCIPRAAR